MTGFLAELRRRNVIRMAGLYLVGAWLVTQVAATLLPIFAAPDWAMKTLVALLAAGFLPALAFAWVFELTPDGLKRDAEIPAAQSIAPQTARRMERGILLLFAIAVAFFAFDKFHLAPQREAALVASTTHAAKSEADRATSVVAGGASIAVLPFVNMSADAENGFFADGISEELLNVLAGVDGLKVASRTSAFSFKGKDIPIPEIARQLGVEHVLEGSVRKQGQRVRITAQLIHAGSDGHLWSETYDRELTDIFKVQEEIAQAITRELEAFLGKRQVAVAASTANLEAYQGFLKGRARFHQRDELLAAIEDLSAAVKLDRDFAEAWIYLAATWAVLPGYIDDEARRAQSELETRTALKRAEALAPRHPMVLALRSRLLEDEGDLVGALALLEESARLQVQDTTPMLWRGMLLLRGGYIDQAIVVLEDAQRMDPLSGVGNGYLALAYLSSGQFEKAEAAARRADSQGWSPALAVLVYDAAARGERARALSLWDEFSRLEPPLTDEGRRITANFRELLRDPANAEALAALQKVAGAMDPEFSIAIDRFDLLLDAAEREIKDGGRASRQWWVRSAWLSSTMGLRTDPRFFAIAEELGLVRLWEARGYPDGCKRVSAAGGDRLDCGATATKRHPDVTG